MIGKLTMGVKLVLAASNFRFVEETVVGIEVDLQRLVAQRDSLDEEFAGGLQHDVALAFGSRNYEVNGIGEGVAGLRLC